MAKWTVTNSDGETWTFPSGFHLLMILMLFDQIAIFLLDLLIYLGVLSPTHHYPMSTTSWIEAGVVFLALLALANVALWRFSRKATS